MTLRGLTVSAFGVAAVAIVSLGAQQQTPPMTPEFAILYDGRFTKSGVE